MTIYDVIKRPLVTEKGITKKDNERTLCFEVAPDANKTLVKAAVEKLFKVKVEDVRTVSDDRQAAAPGKVFRLPFGLEEGLRPAEAGTEGSRVRGDLGMRGRELHVCRLRATIRQLRPGAS